MKTQDIEKEEEIDLVALLQKIWQGRKIIIKTLVIGFLIGLLNIIVSPTQYTATSIFVPQGATKTNSGGINSLAALAGVNLSLSNSEDLPMEMFPIIVGTTHFKKQLVQTPIWSQQEQKDITYFQYCIQKPVSVISTIAKYTIGLPSLIISSVNTTENKEPHVEHQYLNRLSQEEISAFDLLNKQLSLVINEKQKYVTLSFTMEDPIAAAQMAYKSQELLQKTITEFKIKKAQEKLEFIQQRYQEAENDFKDKQHKLATFQDNNRQLMSSLSQTKEAQLRSEFNLAYNIYSELAKQLETQKIQVKEDTPIFTTIQPVNIPLEKSEPKSAKILAIWTFLGIIIGVGIIFLKDFISLLKKKSQEETEVA